MTILHYWEKVSALPSSLDEDQAITGRLLTAYSWVFMLATIAGCLVAIAFWPEQMARPLWVIAFITPVMSLGLLFLRRGKVRLASYLIIGLNYGGIVFLVATGGGINAPGYVGLLMITLLAGIVLGGKTVFTMAALTTLVGLGIAYLENSGQLPPSRFQFTPYNHWLIHSIFTLGFASLQYFASQMMKNSLQRARSELEERTRAEQAMREGEEKYRGLVESLDSLILSVDEEGKVLYINDLGAQQFGSTPRDMVGKNLYQILPAGMIDQQMENARRAIHEDRRLVLEDQSIGQDQPRWYHATIVPIHDLAGRPTHALVNATDIHALKAAQQELKLLNRTLEERIEERAAEVRRTESTYRALFENSNDGIFLFSPEQAHISANQKGLDLLDCTREEYMSAVIVQHPLISGAEFAAAVRGETVPLYERTFQTKKGREVDVEINLSTIRDSSGAVTLLQCVARDITERKKSEEVLRQANHQLEQAMRMKDEFLASMSHELRTPLTGILGISEAMQMQTYGTLNERQLKSVRVIENSGRHLLELINDILDLSKLEAGKLALEIAPVQLEQVCQASIQLIKGMAHTKNQKVSLSMQPSQISLPGDGRRIKQILVNLLSNAVKYTREGGSLGLEVQGDAQAQQARLIIWDTGIGIQPQDLEKLFRPFVQLDSSLTRQHAGTGLGLALVKDLVDLHHGTVAVESTYGQGSRFIFTLPWPQAPAPQAASTVDSRSSGGAAREGADADGTTPLVAMVVDDHEINISILSDFLQSRNVKVVAAQDGWQFLERVAQVCPDIVLMDIQMPGIDGIEAIRRLRAHPNSRAAAIPVIAVTALAMVGDREKCLAAGANAYISKPFHLKQIIELIYQLVQ